MCHYSESTCTQCRQNAVYAFKLIQICSPARLNGGDECAYIPGLIEAVTIWGVCPRHSLMTPPPTPPHQ